MGHIVVTWSSTSWIFSQYAELGNCKHIVQCILKELSMFWVRKMLVFWTWNHHVLSIYWLSTGGFVPSVSGSSWWMSWRPLTFGPSFSWTQPKCDLWRHRGKWQNIDFCLSRQIPSDQRGRSGWFRAVRMCSYLTTWRCGVSPCQQYNLRKYHEVRMSRAWSRVAGNLPFALVWSRPN